MENASSVALLYENQRKNLWIGREFQAKVWFLIMLAILALYLVVGMLNRTEVESAGSLKATITFGVLLLGPLIWRWKVWFRIKEIRSESLLRLSLSLSLNLNTVLSQDNKSETNKMIGIIRVYLEDILSLLRRDLSKNSGALIRAALFTFLFVIGIISSMVYGADTVIFPRDGPEAESTTGRDLFIASLFYGSFGLFWLLSKIGKSKQTK